MKKCEQILKNGNIVLDYDQILTKKEIKDLLFQRFNKVIKEDRKQFILYNKIAILACNVSYLGNPHPLYKKRIQLKKYYLDYLLENSAKNLKTLYLGIYSYKKTRLYVVFEPQTYSGKKSHNSSAHIYSINLQYAKRFGKFDKIDAFGNKIHIFNTYEFIKYIKVLGNDNVYYDFDEIAGTLREFVSNFENVIDEEWNGLDCYKELVNNGDENAKQGEWPGFYFEFLFKNYLKNNKNSEIEWNKGKKDGQVDFDAKLSNKNWLYCDLKAEKLNSDILGNALKYFETVITENDGVVYYICCLYESEKDSNFDYEVTKYWNEKVRDEGKKYQTDDELMNGYGKKMKHSVKPKIIQILKIDNLAYSLLKQNPFNQGVNSNGKKRDPKLKIGKAYINALSIYAKQIH